MNISCCMITTNLPERSSLMENTIDSLNKCDNIFAEKVMSVDTFPKGLSLDWFDKYLNEWSIYHKMKDSHKSMILNHRNAISKAKNDVVFYTEDDILINKVPKPETLEILFNELSVGYISYNNHVWFNFRENPPHIIEFISNPDNYLTINGETFLVKKPMIRDNFYLNFPVAFFRKEVMMKLHEYAMKNCIGMTIEVGLTQAWFALGYDKKFEVLIYLKNDVLNDIKEGKPLTVIDYYNYAQMNFWNNDTNLRHPSVPGVHNVTY